MALTRLEEWELRLNNALAKVDSVLEQRFGTMFTLRPNRQKNGKTSNPKYDGLFTITAKFSLGLAKGIGASYIVDIRTSTFQSVSRDIRQDMLALAQEELQKQLQITFPDNSLQVLLEEDFLRIIGDLSF